MTTYPSSVPSASTPMPVSFSPSSEYPRLREKFIRRLMKHSKKSVSTQILDESLDFAHREIQAQIQNPRSSLAAHLQRYQSMTKQDLFVTAIHQAKPWVTTKTYKRGGKAVLIPEMLTPAQQESFAIRWLIVNSRQLSRPSGPKGGQPMSFCLGNEFVGCLTNQGRTMAQRDQLHKVAEANRAWVMG